MLGGPTCNAAAQGLNWSAWSIAGTLGAYQRGSYLTCTRSRPPLCCFLISMCAPCLGKQRMTMAGYGHPDLACVPSCLGVQRLTMPGFGLPRISQVADNTDGTDPSNPLINAVSGLTEVPQLTQLESHTAACFLNNSIENMGAMFVVGAVVCHARRGRQLLQLPRCLRFVCTLMLTKGVHIAPVFNAVC